MADSANENSNGRTERAPNYAYIYLTPAEVRFLDAAVSRLIPSDELSPGAKEAGVTCFIDHELSSIWGASGRNYRMGPWLQGTPQQGLQSPLTPQEIYREAIREINAGCVLKHGRPFHALTIALQEEILHALEDDQIDLESVSAKAFFGLLWRNTQEGFFADPIHGGNRDKIGWRLIGFPGVAASTYNDHIERQNEPYRVEPVSILDVVEGRVRLDAQGYPKHVPLGRKN
jgi:gluconate 2-dehydrogenase gamma chain